MLEVVPPSALSSDNYRKKILEKIVTAVNSMKPDLINIPEIIDENRLGKPYYRNIRACEFGKELNDLTGKKIIENKVVVHCKGINEFDLWINKSINEFKINNFVFVGGNFDHISYSGLTVNEANNKAKNIKGIKIGNIMIPSRENEAKRMFNKTVSGADFFTSQVLFESINTKKVLAEYNDLCNENKITPAKVFLSFCPVSDSRELYFMKWLGVEIPEETEKNFFKEENNAVKNSIEIAKKVWTDIKDFNKENNISVPVALNVEEIFLHNLDYCVELAEKLNND